MNTFYYKNFEKMFKYNEWWINKKARIDRTIKDHESKDPKKMAKARLQLEVRMTLFQILKMKFEA